MSNNEQQITNNTIVSLTNVSIFQQQNLVLDEVNLRIDQGEFCYLIGKTGSGKSSLLKTLYGDLVFKNGNGQVAGFDLNQLNRKSIPLLRRKLGIVFQDFNLLADRTVGENLDFVLQATGWKNATERKNRINDILTDVGLFHKSFKMPHEISGGEQQRVVIARALLNSPELILADEPTGNLDPETSDEILFLLRNLARNNNTAVIFATHDYRILEKFNGRIIRCQKGKVLDEENFVF
ncbi:MAG: cell division ATP-binding protein FtsE [Saprospiraceae bacterium]